MNSPRVKPVPDGMHTVTPHLICAGALKAKRILRRGNQIKGI